MPRRYTLATILLSVPAFGVAGAISRYNLEMTETRWQIAAFMMLAAGVEVAARLGGPRRASIWRGTLNAATATLAIIAIKFQLEPAAKQHDSAVVRHAIGSVAEEAAGKQGARQLGNLINR